MLIQLETGKSVSAAASALQAAVTAHHFGVMQVHNLQETMVKKGVAFAQPTTATARFQLGQCAGQCPVADRHST